MNVNDDNAIRKHQAKLECLITNQVQIFPKVEFLQSGDAATSLR